MRSVCVSYTYVYTCEVYVASCTIYSILICSHDSDQYSDSFEEDDDRLSSDNEEQEDPGDYCKGVCGVWAWGRV